MTLNPEKQFNSTFTALRVAICLAALFAVFSFVYASNSDYTDVFWADVQEEMTNIYTGSNTVSGMQSALSNFAGNSYPTTVSHYIKFPEKNGNGVCYLASPYENALFINSHGIDGSDDRTGGYINFTSYWAYFGRGTSTYTDSTQYIFMIYIRSDRCGLFRSYNKGTSIVSAWYPYYPYNEGTLTQFYYGGDAELSKIYGDTLRDVGTGRFEFTYEGYESHGDNNYWGDYTGRLVYFPPDPVYEDDSRMQFSTFQSQLGNDILHIELSQFINNGFNISNTTLNELSFVIEYTNKTTGNISEMTYTFDNDSDYFHEFGSNSFIERIYLNIPYYEFSGYDLAKNSFPDFSDVRITSAILDLDYYVSGAAGSTNIKEFITTNYYLQHEYTEIVPGDVINPNYENTIIYDNTVINNMKTALHNKTSQYSFISGDWIFVDENSLPNFESWATVFINYVWFADANSDSTYNGHWWQMANNLPSTADLTRPFDPSEFIELNKTWSFYDVVLLKVWRVTVNNVATVPVLQSYDLAGYLVLISDRYYQHYEVENQLGIIEILQNDATNSVVFYDSIRERVDDFETQTLKAISGENNSIFSYINDLDSDLNTGISRIVDSIPDTFDDTSILDKLEDILDALTDSVEDNEIDTPQECVQFYLDHSNDDLEDINITLRPAFFEGATLDFLYNLVSEGEDENTLRSSMRDGSSTSSFNILWKLYNIIRSVYRDSEAGETITFVLDDMGDSNSYYNALFRSDFDPNNWGYLYE